MENPTKVQQKLSQLNSGLASLPWFPADGFHSLNTFAFGGPGKGPQFYPGEGIPIKTFINRETGEIKTFSAYLFID